MSVEGSVTKWIAGFKAGDDDDLARLWDRYCRRLTGLARKKLRGAARVLADENDVANDALMSLWRGARAGKFPLLTNRDSLWGLLVKITVRKAIDLVAYENAIKRKPPKSEVETFDEVMQSGPGPATLAIWEEEYNRLLQALPDDTLRQIAEWRVEGYQVQEIADKLDCARETVFRKLRIIKKILLAESST